MRLTRRTVLQKAAAAAAVPAVTSVGVAQAADTDSAAAPLRIGAPVLIVRDLDLVTRYYADAMGFDVLNKDTDEAQLGAGQRLLLTLRRRGDATPEPRGAAGLFHTAFLMPDRAALGRWLPQAARAGAMFVGASDHLVSEALYLADPEGNGIEVYADRPRATWQWDGADVKMATIDLDLEDLMRAGGNDPGDRPQVPDSMTVGHIHLRVGGIPEAEAFYNGALGFDVTARRDGATFYSSGRYHHHVATNTWESAGASRRSGGITGLSSFEVLAQDAATFDVAAERWLKAGAQRTGDVVTLADPWGNSVLLRMS